METVNKKIVCRTEQEFKDIYNYFLKKYPNIEIFFKIEYLDQIFTFDNKVPLIIITNDMESIIMEWCLLDNCINCNDNISCKELIFTEAKDFLS